MRTQTRIATATFLLIFAAGLAACGSESETDTSSSATELNEACPGIEDADCATLRSIESTVDLVEFGEDPCALGFEYDDEGFDQVGVECRNGRVTKLGLHAAELTEVPDEMFEGLNGLEALSLGGNKIESIAPSAFAGLDALEHLFLFENQLTDLPKDLLADLVELQIFTVERNELAEIPESLFANNQNLEVVQLNGNNLSTLTANHFDDLDSLVTLYLDNNDLTEIPSDLLTGAPNLVDITLSSNKISNFPAGLFASNPTIAKIGLNSNDGTLSESMFGGEPRSLENLSIKCNGAVPKDFALLTVSDEIRIDEDQSAQTNLGQWLDQDSIAIESDC